MSTGCFFETLTVVATVGPQLLLAVHDLHAPPPEHVRGAEEDGGSCGCGRPPASPPRRSGRCSTGWAMPSCRMRADQRLRSSATSIMSGRCQVPGTSSPERLERHPSEIDRGLPSELKDDAVGVLLFDHVQHVLQGEGSKYRRSEMS